jgi:dTDP-4-dehydrorhamnose 3,5-epimerase
MNRFTLTDLPLVGLLRIERKPLADGRGSFVRLFCAEELAAAGWNKPITQINHSYTAKRGTVRGMHFQYPPHAEMKLVICLRGEVWDVAVDLREGSPTFLRWHAERLSAENNAALLIPEGFAHGFQTLTDEVELLYLHTHPYVPAAEGRIHPQEARLAIAWPLAITELSERDAAAAPLPADFAGVAA